MISSKKVHEICRHLMANNRSKILTERADLIVNDVSPSAFSSFVSGFNTAHGVLKSDRKFFCYHSGNRVLIFEAASDDDVVARFADVPDKQPTPERVIIKGLYERIARWNASGLSYVKNNYYDSPEALQQYTIPLNLEKAKQYINDNRYSLWYHKQHGTGKRIRLKQIKEYCAKYQMTDDQIQQALDMAVVNATLAE